MVARGPLGLVILDGWGWRDEVEGNACRIAETPRFNDLWTRSPHVLMAASGLAVGLPEGQMGNSEVGHQNIGAGRVLYQDFTRITRAVEEGSLFANEVLIEAVRHAKRSGGRLHLIGLVSNGGVHSHIEHLFALLDLAAREGQTDVVVHAITDGRDCDPHSGAGHLAALRGKLLRLGFGAVGTVSGRYYAMDRDKRWDRTKLAWDAIVRGEGPRATDPVEALKASYAISRTDEFVIPVVIVDGEGRPWGTVRDFDSVIFFNFRPDRGRQLTEAFISEPFAGFARGPRPDVHYVTMTQYDDDFDCPVAFPPEFPTRTFGEVISEAGLKQLRIAETEKYAHVTYFFNGRREEPFPGEERVLIPSPKVPTYDLKPEMSAREVTDEVLARTEEGSYDVMILNFANPDMVGHTGVLAAAVVACEAVDHCMGQVIDGILAKGGVALVTADHGNAEVMIDPVTKEPHTAHTTNPVPLMLIGERYRGARLREGGRLADLAPTMLEILGLPRPSQMTGESLISRGAG